MDPVKAFNYTMLLAGAWVIIGGTLYVVSFAISAGWAAGRRYGSR